MVMLSDKIDMTPNEHIQIKQMAEFILLFHGSNPSPGTTGFDSSKVRPQAVPERRKVLSKASQRSIMRHIWYITKKNVLLYLFDEGISTKEKTEVAAAFQALAQPEVLAPGTPVFPQARVSCLPMQSCRTWSGHAPGWHSAWWTSAISGSAYHPMSGQVTTATRV